MKKVFVVSLLLVSVFLIGSSEMALAQTCQDYCCDAVGSYYGVVTTTQPICAELCYDDVYAELYGYFNQGFQFFTCYLYPAPNAKHRLGTADSIFNWGGCSVEQKGRTIIANLTWIQDDSGGAARFTCTPCTSCPY